MIKKLFTYFFIIFLLFLNSSFLYAGDLELIKIQSGLEKIDFQTYKCKKQKCKINLIVEKYTDKDYLCVWNFGGGTFKTKNTDKKCNPGYVDYGVGVYNINLKIYKDDDLENILEETTIKIVNQELESNFYSAEASLNSDYKDILPKIIIGEEKDPESSLGGQEGTDSEGQIEVESGGEGSVILNSFQHLSEEKDNSKKDSETASELQEKRDIFPRIIIQSGLEYLSGNIYKCKKKECKINLTSSGFSDKEYGCLWDFSGGVFKTKDTDKKCNPGYVDYETGKYEVILKVIDKQDASRVFKTNIFIKNEEEDSETSLGGQDDVDSGRQIEVDSGGEDSVMVNSLEKGNFEKDSKISLEGQDGSFESNLEGQENIQKPKAKITLQGRLAKYKKLIGNKLICEGVDKCSINFTGEESQGKKLKYFWDYGNGLKFEKSNPKSVYFKKGRYKISLKVMDELGGSDIAYFYVDVIPKNAILEDEVDKNIFGNLKIAGVLPNTSGRDDREFIEIENKSSYKLNLKGLVISDASKSYKIKEDLYLYPFSKKRFYKSTTKLSLGNKSDLVRLSYNNVVLDELKWNFDVPDNFLLTHKNINLDFEKVYVERVIDGDTIKVKFDNNRFAIVRLLGVDTPETKDPRKEIQFYGIEASEFTEKSLKGKYVYLEYDKLNLTGKYGRLLAYVYLDKQKNKSFNEILVEKGYARVFLKYPFKYEKSFLKSQTQAKKQKLGIWQNKDLKKELLKEIKEEKKILEEKSLYDFDKIKFVVNKKEEIENNLDKILKVNGFSKDLGMLNWFKGKNIKDSKIKQESKIIQEKQKSLKKSISYRVSKNKKSFRISGISQKFKTILLKFQGEEYELKVDKNNKFELNLLKIIPGEFYAEFYGIDELGNKIFLKKSRKIVLSNEYVSSIGKLKKKGRKKKIKIGLKSINKQNILEKTKEYISKDLQNLQDFGDKIVAYFDFKAFVLKILTGILVILFGFMILWRKKILQ